MKINLCLKIGSAILASSKHLFDSRAKQNARDVNEAIHFEITSMVNTNTEEYLITI